MTEPPITLTDLRTIDLFDDLDDEHLASWVALARPATAAPGELIAEQGEQGPFDLLLEGRARALLVDGDRIEPVGHHDAPTWMGAISALTGGPLGVRMQAETACRLARIDRDDFRRLALASPGLHQRVMQQVAPVINRVTGVEHQRERLASLGTMAAGLAHELNNPAAAARRAAGDLAEALDVMSVTVGRFVDSGLSREAIGALFVLQQETAAAAAARPARGALDAADAEDDLLARLERLGLQDAWRLAEPLAAAGVDAAWVDRVGALADGSIDTVLEWIAASLAARGLAAELRTATEQMSTLVGALKSYTAMGRGRLVDADVHEGLETTLVVLGHKLQPTTIAVVRDYDPVLPAVTVRGSELNQAWTSLLDNAIDALGTTGTITIATRTRSGGVEVEIADDGPGIEPAIRERIFEPFFTTKDVGRGTGLGLAIARGIVADHHGGTLTLEPEPGRTAFRVWLPLTQTA